MEKLELESVKQYAVRLNGAKGDFLELNKEERHHFALLLRKYELEQQLDKLAEELSQGKLL